MHACDCCLPQVRDFDICRDEPCFAGQSVRKLAAPRLPCGYQDNSTAPMPLKLSLCLSERPYVQQASCSRAHSSSAAVLPAPLVRSLKRGPCYRLQGSAQGSSIQAVAHDLADAVAERPIHSTPQEVSLLTSAQTTLPIVLAHKRMPHLYGTRLVRSPRPPSTTGRASGMRWRL